VDPTAQMTDLAQIRHFVLAGRALFTIVSKRTSERRTFRIRAGSPTAAYPRPGHFVDVLAGPDNERDYRYVGFMHEGDDGALRFKSRAETTESADQIFQWFLGALNSAHGVGPGARGIAFTAQAEFWHAGRCGRCGRTLTTPESVASGIGPVCEGRES